MCLEGMCDRTNLPNLERGGDKKEENFASPPTFVIRGSNFFFNVYKLLSRVLTLLDVYVF